jgi:formylglycine-generating enzyme required for sulfatase activity
MRIIFGIIGFMALSLNAQMPKVKGYHYIVGTSYELPRKGVYYWWDSTGTAKMKALDADSASDIKDVFMLKGIQGFGISETEVTNKEWWEFVFAAVDSASKGQSTGDKMKDFAKLLKLDTCVKCDNPISIWMANKGRNQIYFDGVPVLPSYSCWLEDFPHGQMQPMADYYFPHVSYAGYPVVGISKEQALAFCRWKTQQLKSKLKNGDVQHWEFALPTDSQFIAAAMHIPDNKKRMKGYAPYLPFTRNSKGQFLLNYNAYMDQEEPNNWISSDGFMTTCPVISYFPNQNGLYNLHGNVAEWTCSEVEPTVGVKSSKPLYKVKGGSYMDPAPCVWARSYTALPASKGDARVGFRLVLVSKKGA